MVISLSFLLLDLKVFLPKLRTFLDLNADILQPKFEESYQKLLSSDAIVQAVSQMIGPDVLLV